MTSFGWKRKAGEGVVRTASQAFEDEAKDEELDNEVTRGEVDWLTLVPKKRLISLEDARAKSRRLSNEAAILAQAERYWEAINKWDEALLVNPCDAHMLEMKAQALMAVGEVFPSVQAAQQAVQADPTWWVARQTLGRAQLNLGEVTLAIRSFSKAVLLDPTNRELWEEDLAWARSLLDRSNTIHNHTVPKPVALSSEFSSPSRVVDTGEAASGPCEEECCVISAVKKNLSRDNSETNHCGEGESEVRRTVLNVPANYVQLRR